jgi:hypothetical protein
MPQETHGISRSTSRTLCFLGFQTTPAIVPQAGGANRLSPIPDETGNYLAGWRRLPEPTYLDSNGLRM